MLILEGKQDRGKSSALRIIGEPWFTDELKDLGSKDTAISIAGRWIIEFGELDAMRSATVEKLKAFLSRREDRFRPPYGSIVVNYKRQCVFAGTTNSSNYLRDETGHRRFWPVACRDQVDREALARDRDQLWAEAIVKYKQGERWWLHAPDERRLAVEEQERRFEADPWEEAVAIYVLKSNEITTGELLENVAEISLAQSTRAAQMRMAQILEHLGWERSERRLPNGIKQRFFVRGG
jgi:predicted P-loop ATPase